MVEKGRKSKGFVFIFISIIFGLLFYVWQHIQVICRGYRINDLKRITVSLRVENNLLKKKVSRYTNYEEIERIASSRLKMVYPEAEDIVYLIK